MEEAGVAKKVISMKKEGSNGDATPPPQQPEIGTIESINAMLAELQEQNNALRNRTVQLRGDLAKAIAIIAARDATIKALQAK